MSAAGPRLVIRADASAAVGMGHLMRCRVIAAEWLLRGPVTLVTAAPPPVVLSLLADDGIDVVDVGGPGGMRLDPSDDADQTADHARRSGASAVLVDGYDFDARYLWRLRRGSGAVIALLDDEASADAYPVDVVVNPSASPGAVRHYGRVAAGAVLLTGLEHLLLRREFVVAAAADGTPPVRDAVLVTMGGSDPEGVTALAVEGLIRADLSGLRLRVMLGDLSSGRRAVVDRLRGLPGAACVVGTRDVAAEMSRARVAVSAAGGTAHELAHLGVPSLLVEVAPNQASTAEVLEGAGAARRLGGPRALVDGTARSALEQLLGAPDVLADMERAGRALSDGRGPARVVTALLDPSGAHRGAANDLEA